MADILADPIISTPLVLMLVGFDPVRSNFCHVQDGNYAEDSICVSHLGVCILSFKVLG